MPFHVSKDGQSKERGPCGERPGDDAEGRLLGGTHSVRPRIRAGGRPRHNIINGGKRTPGGLMARSPGGGKAFPAGVRSPLLRGVGQPGSDGLAGKGPGIGGGPFSRRDALRASANTGRTQAEAQHNHRGQRNARWPNGAIARWRQSLPSGRAEPAPPWGGPARVGWPCGERPGDGVKAFFSEGRTPCVREYGPDAGRGTT